MIATITSKGQVTLPKTIRKKLHLNAGDRLDFFIRDDGHIEAVPKKSSMKELKAMIPPPKKNITNEDMKKAITEGYLSSNNNLSD
jgi:antitoxin PrlF